MNGKKLIVCSAGFFLLLGCTKQKIAENVGLESRQNDYGVTVNNGTLKFRSFQKYYDLQNMSESQKCEFYAYVANLPGFQSRKEFVNDSREVRSRGSVNCNCEIDDEFIQSITNENYMVEIENFMVKLDGCEKKVFVSDQLAPDAAVRCQALVNCNFSYPDLYEYTFEQAVEDELPWLRDSLNGEEGLRCREVAISGRFASEPEGQNSCEHYPPFELEYNNFGVSGTIRVRMQANVNGTDATIWSFEFSDNHYRKRCDGDVDTGPFTAPKTLQGSYYKHIVHSGKRLTNAVAGVDAYLIRVRLVSTKMCYAESPYIQIVP